MRTLERLFGTIEGARVLDPVAGAVAAAADRALPGPARNLLHGVVLGHPAHAVLTDLPIGFFTGAAVLDLGGGGTGKAARRFVGLGLLTAVPTAAAGLADWVALGQAKRERRVGLVHAAANATALTCYALSYRARGRDRRAAGVGLSLLGLGAMTAGGALGGHLAFRQKVGVNHAPAPPQGGPWTDVCAGDDLVERRLTKVTLGDTEVLLVRTGSAVRALANTCSHLGGPLSDGELTEVGGVDCAICPWHGSAFALTDGRVVRGPATAPQPVYDARLHGGQVQVRLQAPGG